MQLQDKYIRIHRQGWLPIMVGDRLNALDLADACVKAGVSAIEITCRRRGVLEEIRQIKLRYPKLLVLTGSVVEEPKLLKYLRQQRDDYPTMEELVACGVDGFVAQFCFSNEALLRYSNSHIMIPGVETIKEATEAIRYGAHFVKFCAVSPERIGQINSEATFKLLPVFYTGGASTERIQAYVKAGAALLGGGWDLMLGNRYEAQQEKAEPEVLLASVKAYLDAFQAARMSTVPDYGQQLLADSEVYLKGLRHYHPFTTLNSKISVVKTR